jgi:hypothetical protein
MIPLIAAGAVSLANNVVEAWKNHADNVAAAKAATQVTNSASFQDALKTAATQAITTAQQQSAQALPGQVQSVTQQALQNPALQSMARTAPGGAIKLQFNANGDLSAVQPNGTLSGVNVSQDVRQQLQQINSALKASGNAAQVSTSLAGSPVHVTLTAV